MSPESRAVVARGLSSTAVVARPHGLDVEIARGSLVGLLGPSGCGSRH